MSNLDRPLLIARIALVRLLRERSNLFFVFFFPLMLVLLIGLSFGGQQARTVLVVTEPDSRLAERLIDVLRDDEDLRVVEGHDLAGALDSLARARVAAVVTVPEGSDRVLEADPSTPGPAVEVGLATRPEAPDARLAVEAAVAAVAEPLRTRAVAISLGAPATSPALVAERGAPSVGVVATVHGSDELAAEFAGLGTFELGAASQLVLFVFLTTMSGATRIVESRELGVTRRMLATPTTAGQVVLGEGLGRFAVALFQAFWIVAATMVVFGVDWGNPVATLAVIAAFAAASASSALLLGAVSRNVNQAGGLSTLFGLVLAALGGSMVPLDIFGDTLRRVAHLTPHAWANDAFADITRRGGGLGDVLPEVAVLLGIAAVLWALAGRRLRAAITD